MLCLSTAGALSCDGRTKNAPPSTTIPPRVERLALTPPMGFNNWNAFGCDVSEALIKETADIFVSKGLKDAGYEYVNIDDCWALRERGPDGRLVPNPKTFPSGIQGVADYVHGKGLKLGIYGDAGTRTCAGYPGSLGHEELDAQTWAEWGVDYVKYDNCYNQSDGSRGDYVRRYTAMREAIDKTGRPMVYSICEWGTSQPWEWATNVGHLWRTTGDISDNWSSLRSIIAFNAPLARYAGPGHWNDPDMLEIGNGGMTPTEYRTHMGMWAVMAAPLIIGTDLRKASAETLAILGNREIIAIDQDSLGKQGSVVINQDGLMVLNKPLENGDHAVALYNSTDALAVISVRAAELGLPVAEAYRLSDVWTGVALQAKSLISAGVAAHGTVVYRTRASAPAERLPPAVSVGATLPTLVSGLAKDATLTTIVTNRGVDTARQVKISIRAPNGWAFTATKNSPRESLANDEAHESAWAVRMPQGTAAGQYPIAVTAAYGWGDPSARQEVSVTSELLARVVAPPLDGTTHLSQLSAVTSRNAVGPVELDMSNGAASPSDGNLIAIGGKVYTRGLGTHGPSELSYYLGGRCSALTTEVGIDDAAPSGGAASFRIYADDAIVADSGVLTADDGARRLSAKLTGATWLKLVVDPGSSSTGDQADWALPLLVCGGSTAPTTPEKTLFSFESGSEQWTVANPGAGGSVSPSKLFATHGEQGLQVVTPTDGNWFGRSFPEPLDLSAYSSVKFDLETGKAGTSGEIAVQLGPANSWCQGGLWTWTNPNSTKTIKGAMRGLECPQGIARDLTQVRGIFIYLKGGTFQIDNVRAE